MEKKKMIIHFSVISLIILLAALSRLIPHPPNFSPIGAMSLFGAAYYAQRRWAFIIPIASMWTSDLILNNVVYSQYFDHFVWLSPSSLCTYGAFVLIALVGFVFLRKISVTNVIGASLTASVVFFLVSNLGVWVSTEMYAKSWTGLIDCYAAGVPFFRYTLSGDLIYSGISFGVFELLKIIVPALNLQKIS
ncbi:MAG: hypothetical protein BGN96_07485 [Bacteroidales bacterium 45-6]|nr:MAG: hypothetical protein BGN96_07485 [Bacteroidales bacterium 45-6]